MNGGTRNDKMPSSSKVSGNASLIRTDFVFAVTYPFVYCCSGRAVILAHPTSYNLKGITLLFIKHIYNRRFSLNVTFAENLWLSMCQKGLYDSSLWFLIYAHTLSKQSNSLAYSYFCDGRKARLLQKHPSAKGMPNTFFCNCPGAIGQN